MGMAGAVFGSRIIVQDLDEGVHETYVLARGEMLDIAAGHVSLASPIGQALLGSQPGTVVIVDTPQRRRRLRVVKVSHEEETARA